MVTYLQDDVQYEPTWPRPLVVSSKQGTKRQ